MESIRNINLNPYFFATGLSLLLLGFTSCSDDTLTDSSIDTRLIRFNIADGNSDHWETRNGISNSKILTLEGGKKPLFLVPYIENTTNETTRSQEVDSSNIESFGVFAGYASEAGLSSYKADYMNNVKVTRSSDWTPTEEYLWPGQDALHFNAYSPYLEKTSSEGITGCDVSLGEPILNFKVPTKVSDQLDLLYASPINASSSPCTLSFLHALTCIRFVTGAELAPCIIKEISITGSSSSGSLNIETGEWSNLSEKTNFTISPNLSLSASEGSTFVESDLNITSNDEIFFLIPEILGEDANISITFDFNGEETILTSSLANQEFPQGKTLTYRISANPEADSLILNITGDFNTVYKGSSNKFTVKSVMNDNGNTEDVSWIAEFVDENGNVIDQPDWISDFTLSGSGETQGTLITELQDIKFNHMNAITMSLQNTEDINVASGHNPYNLSSASGASTVENTANTYVINSPGTYSLPLVYGNAITNGATNTQSYSPSTHNSRALKVFTNHLNNAITSPYIYENSDCTPADAILIWEDGLNLVRNVRLSYNAKELIFDIPKSTIREGNALLAVQDAKGEIMWSWQIWVTDYVPSTGFNSLSANNTTYSLASLNLGYISGGDTFEFPEMSVKVRFTQTGLPDDKQPLSKTITITQSGIACSTSEYNPYYQWGRKDPMMSGDQKFYDASHNEITVFPNENADSYQAGKNLMQAFILHPDTFYTGTHENDESSAGWTAYPYVNFWDGTYNAANPKTIYDPNVAGYKVPYNEPLIDFTSQNNNNPTERYTFAYVATNTETQKAGFYVTVKSSGEIIFFPALGYRTGTTATTASDGTYANYWLAHAMPTLKSGAIVDFLITSTEITAHQTTDPLFHGMCIRGIKE